MEEPKRGFQGVWINAGLWNHPDLSWMEKCLVAEIDYLANNNDEGGPCRASAPFLAQRMNSTVSSMENILSKLTQKGILWQIGFDGRKVWRCVGPEFTCNPSKYREWAKDPRFSLPSEISSHFQVRAESSSHSQVRADLTPRLELPSLPGETEVPVEIPIEKREDSSSTSDEPKHELNYVSSKQKEETKPASIPVPEDFKLQSVIRSNRTKRPVAENPPNEEQFKAYAESKGITFNDSKYLWNHWTAMGWMIGTRPMLDWQAALRSWQTAGYLPSQRKDRP